MQLWWFKTPGTQVFDDVVRDRCRAMIEINDAADTAGGTQRRPFVFTAQLNEKIPREERLERLMGFAMNQALANDLWAKYDVVLS
ncbi:hypothetical protein BK662_15350 [Pseudomonas frederiksbergensis]|uniref:Uncharacterized protein n=1 Tax=Pseudomonas frederiksbergensis TaxID=104087 RepID=A0A423HP02_9PSED|nr:hypothetical protein BK662_15350 [Pseudomonas frederiksbergensis]